MPSKTFVPAFEAKVGNWTYYSCLMSYAAVAREINFAHELGGNQDLGTMIQRGVGTRTTEITNYLLTNENRFLGAIIVAAWGGAPEYIPLEMEKNSENGDVLAGMDRNFGVLTFDGTHQFFALDGQHRLKAIKDAVKRNPELGREDITVIVVPHFDDEAGRRRTRRLFTNINRNAVKTTAQENIALDEDDGFAILTRRLLDDHQFLRQDGVVQVFSKVGNDGELKLATRQVGVTGTAWTTIGVLYDLLTDLGFGLHESMSKTSQRATDDILDESYEALAKRIDELLHACGNMRERYEAHAAPKDLRAPKGRDGDGHPFMRPAVQVQVVRAARHIIEQSLLEWPELLRRLGELDWKMTSPPFSAVWQETPDGSRKGKMIPAKENNQALYELLLVHLAPASRAQIDRAIRAYRQVKNERYPVTAEELARRLPIATE
ncbi:DGQHR domain-containing protein [Streptomyces soliscabiei]|uniref:DGQHR domain-containing protein n=1 Tax=Streptomyces soliscabiei TaxID=588897 RepID=UPI0029A9211C|nr:DNA sulfur modification protein DndB [Streptomyces sp. NY05-11A]MDX2683230.1 DNA sulfur modification protein DndB [Streptomyces sp. NY05-11A]